MDKIMLATQLYDNRIFGLDAQLVVDTVITLIAIFALFILLSYLLFKPARNLMNQRQQLIQGQLDEAAVTNQQAESMKAEYDSKLSGVQKETEKLLAEARKKALLKETEIVDEAKEEADRITARANKEIELEKSKAKDEVKQEIIEVASLMAAKFVEASMDEEKQAQLVDETLEKLGDGTWEN